MNYQDYSQLSSAEKKKIKFGKKPMRIRLLKIFSIAVLSFVGLLLGVITLSILTADSSDRVKNNAHLPEKVELDPTERAELLIDKCKEFNPYVEQKVKSHLNFPLTADFQGSPDWKIMDLDSQFVMVTGTVESKNAFGVPVESRYWFQIEFKNDTLIWYDGNVW